jgi:hypothetical protein
MLTIPGRGLHIGTSGKKHPLVFQTALPWTIDDTALQTTELHNLGQKMADRCGAVYDDQPQEVPEHIHFGKIPTMEKGLALGLALDGNGVVGNYSDSDTSVLTLVGLDAALRLSVADMITKQAALNGRYEKQFTIYVGDDAVSTLEKLRTEVKANMNNGCAQKKYILIIHNFAEVYCSLPDEQRTLLDKFILYGGNKFGVDCLFTSAPKQLTALPENDAGIIPASITLFRRPMLYLDNAVASSDARFKLAGHNDLSMGAEDAEYVVGFEKDRRAVRIRRMLNT